MPTLRERKNPSSGTKVHPGKDDPVHREAAGLVAPESLAAESVQHGGEFAQNRNAQQEGVESSGLKAQSGREGGEAPGYVADQYIKDTKGPHGKNIKEGVDEGKAGEKNDGLARALRAEPGSEDDPSRSFYGKTYEDMPVIPEEKSSLRPPRPSDVDSGKQSSTSGSKQEETRRDAPRNTDVLSEQDVEAEEMEHQRYGEAQPQLVPTDMIETMISAQGRKKESLNDG
ncbi:hypothetical protein T069G_09942 [Trichoderma breve]|uniref:Uncharacterized protein n=1 Tax=Trichoderma breve TaxID=2034170 RepID=A0A9W9B614_9HYPO|nr:hypothetical protein T069G_09942 [Trichoderma breve]KAJ4856574.1 hypothetical protein T069G_09942 [Trichoderma breve]